MVATAKRKQILDVWAAVDSLHAQSGLAPADPGFTKLEYARRYGLTLSGAATRLGKLVRDAKLIAGSRIENGHRIAVYRFPETA